MKKLIFVLLFLIVSADCCALFPQDRGYEEWLKKEKEKFEKYLSDEDKKFTDFLRKEWVQQGLSPADFPLDKPKPKIPPVYTPPQDKKPEIPVPDSNKEPEINKTPEPEIINPPLPDPPAVPIPETVSPPALNLSIYSESVDTDFFGSKFTLLFNPQLAISATGEMNKDIIADFWKSFSSSEHKGIIEQFLIEQKKLGLNGFGYARLIYQTASRRYKNPNERVLFTWFVLNKSGYIARVAYVKKNLFLILHSENQIYGVNFFEDNTTKKRYYLVPLEKGTPAVESVYIYKDDFPDAVKPVTFGFASFPVFTAKADAKKIRWHYRGKEYQITVQYNKQLTDFLEWYPQVDFAVYFSSGMSAAAGENLLKEMQPLLKGMKQTEAANFLLHFVQQATEYKTDDEQFKREKPMFAEESLRYNYSDCEDRSVLYAWLVKNLLGLEVIGLDYPEHIATAVKFNPPFEGDSVTYKGATYFICDPTYIGADIGICMKLYENVTPKIIETNSR